MHIVINFRNVPSDITDIIIAELQNTAEGFEETDNGLKVIFLKESYSTDEITELASTYQLQYDIEEIAPQNWNALWESNFSPVIVDDFVGIRASFHEPLQQVQHEIVITPKMSFGTGHHATTHLMMQQMRKISFPEKSVFDFGTGTGVLAILAYQLGAKSIYANDIDEWSILNARENFERNNTAGIRLVQSDSAIMGESFDIILANINRNVLLENMKDLSIQLNANGQLLLSGILEEDLAVIKEAAESNQLSLVDKNGSNNWLCLHFVKQ
ncbi:50S ribosomal protein L11 methyltransferase [Niabella yanshanensis]|uniref:Ribosomal protein L11 methyltransferase n=1 Tax=Niabella yanshanensis TaxID=577386 RepID=A0ABZ0W512_9BACT|nr:50S ribosomal protein L11 methyltransferase [Niabella yanshanensis]WQD37723.1 50S ribosomal protein L11 methyltransferase [Niabella yanshanensis]